MFCGIAHYIVLLGNLHLTFIDIYLFVLFTAHAFFIVDCEYHDF